MRVSETTIANSLITSDHLRRKAFIYLRQSTLEQVRRNSGSTDFQRSQVELARQYGWPDHLIQVVDEDLGRSGSSIVGRSGWKAMLDDIAANLVGAVFAANISRLSRQLLDFEKDRRRDQRALVAGFRVVRITYRQLCDHPEEVVELLRTLLHPVLV